MKRILSAIVVQCLALYGYSFLFMLEGQPARHNSFTLQVLACVCIGLFFLAPVVAILWILFEQEFRTKETDEVASLKDDKIDE